jgi:Family of unknown function (DUF6037)
VNRGRVQNCVTNEFVINENLKLLWREMRRTDRTRQGFELTVRGRNRTSVSFAAMFIADGEPWVLRIASKGIDPRYERVRVYPGFKMFVGDLKPDFMGWLQRLLELEPDPENPFTEKKFLKGELARQTPHRVTRRVPLPSEVPIDRTTIEEGSKIYFVRWVAWGSGRHVTEENLMKTGELISWEAEAACRRYNVSTCWSADLNDAHDIGDPLEARVRADSVKHDCLEDVPVTETSETQDPRGWSEVQSSGLRTVGHNTAVPPLRQVDRSTFAHQGPAVEIRPDDHLVEIHSQPQDNHRDAVNDSSIAAKDTTPSIDQSHLTSGSNAGQRKSQSQPNRSTGILSKLRRLFRG